MLTKNEKVLVTPDLLENFTEINKALDRCCELALKLPLPNKQIALMTDASFSAAGYAVLIEDDPLEKYTSTRKAFAPSMPRNYWQFSLTSKSLDISFGEP